MENVYKPSLAFELGLGGISCLTEKTLDVYYKGKCVGVYKADLIVQERVIVELKCVRSIGIPHIRQLKNYLRATGLSTGPILNFQVSPLGMKRVWG